MQQPYDVIIIGGGPAGASAAIYTARAQLKTLVLDKPGKGGSLEYAEHVANFPGMAQALPGAELIRHIRAQAASFGAEFREDVALGTALAGEVKMVFCEGDTYQGRAVIIATGALERTLKLPGEEEYLGRGVSICATCDAAFYEGLCVIVAGNDDYAVEEALAIGRYAARIIFTIPNHRTVISPERMEELRAEPKIEIRQGWRVREILGDGERMRAVRFINPQGEQEELAADGLFLFVGGAKPTTSFLQGEVATGPDGGILAEATDRTTNLPKVYAVGDVCSGHVRQAVIAAAEGCLAALAAERDLHGKTRLQPDYH